MPRSLRTHLRPGLGARLRSARDRAGLSQRQLAFPGCTAAYISRLEADARAPSLQMINALAERLHVDPVWLATGEETDAQTAAAAIMKAEAQRDRAVGELRAVRAALAAVLADVDATIAFPSKARP